MAENQINEWLRAGAPLSPSGLPVFGDSKVAPPSPAWIGADGLHPNRLPERAPHVTSWTKREWIRWDADLILPILRAVTVAASVATVVLVAVQLLR